MKINKAEIIDINLIKETSPSIKLDLDGRYTNNLEASLLKYGQITPIIVDESYTIIKGRSIYNLMKKLGAIEISVVVLSTDDYPRVYLELSWLHQEFRPASTIKLMCEVDPEDNFTPLSPKEFRNMQNYLKVNLTQLGFSDENKKKKVAVKQVGEQIKGFI